MQPRFAEQIAPYVESKLEGAKLARVAGDARKEFFLLERVHVIGQKSTYWHVKVQVLILAWAIRNHSVLEVLGQVFRVAGVATKTVFGLVPKGNIGGVTVSPFKKMPIESELAVLIQKAKSST